MERNRTGKKMIAEAFLFFTLILASADQCHGIRSTVRHAGPSGSSSSKGGKGTLSDGAIAGIVCGSLAGSILIALLMLLKFGVLQKCCRDCCKRSARSDATVKYAAEANVAGDSSRHSGGLTTPSTGAVSITSSNYDNNNVNDSKTKEDYSSSARYRGTAPPPSYERAVSGSAYSPQAYTASDELPTASGSTHQQSYAGNYPGGLAYSANPGNGLPYSASPGNDSPYTANPGNGLSYLASPGPPYTATPGNGPPYVATPYLTAGSQYATNPGGDTLPYSANPNGGVLPSVPLYSGGGFSAPGWTST